MPDATISMWDLVGTLNFSFTEVCLNITKSDVGPLKSCVTVSKDRFMPGLLVPLTNLLEQKEHNMTRSQFTHNKIFSIKGTQEVLLSKGT